MNNLFIVHMNGTSKGELFEQHQNVLVKAQELEELLHKAAPNMRDYYPLENGRELFEAAVTQYRATVIRVLDVQAWAVEGALHARGEAVP